MHMRKPVSIALSCLALAWAASAQAGAVRPVDPADEEELVPTGKGVGERAGPSTSARRSREPPPGRAPTASTTTAGR